MKKETIHFEYDVFDSSEELNTEDKSLLEAAREATSNAYAPYSNFLVGAVAKLQNGETVSGTNQENASYPVGICAERALLSTAATMFKDIPIVTIAISYNNLNGESSNPVSPCGMCRQALREYEERTSHAIRLILSGRSGKVFIINNVSQLLPFSFGKKDLSSPL